MISFLKTGKDFDHTIFAKLTQTISIIAYFYYNRSSNITVKKKNPWQHFWVHRIYLKFTKDELLPLMILIIKISYTYF